MADHRKTEDGTEIAVDLAALHSKLASSQPGSPERAKFLKRLKEKVRAGEYQVDVNELAKKIIADAERKARG